jgi:hypothetical protein
MKFEGKKRELVRELIFLYLQIEPTPFEKDFLKSCRKRIDELSPKMYALLLKLLRKRYPRSGL